MGRKRRGDRDRETASGVDRLEFLWPKPLSLSLSVCLSLVFALGVSVLMGPSVSIRMDSCNAAYHRDTYTNDATNTHLMCARPTITHTVKRQKMTDCLSYSVF